MSEWIQKLTQRYADAETILSVLAGIGVLGWGIRRRLLSSRVRYIEDRIDELARQDKEAQLEDLVTRMVRRELRDEHIAATIKRMDYRLSEIERRQG